MSFIFDIVFFCRPSFVTFGPNQYIKNENKNTKHRQYVRCDDDIQNDSINNFPFKKFCIVHKVSLSTFHLCVCGSVHLNKKK